ncbi:hypothetical protein ACFPOB_20710 [Bosea eneae]|uniref:GcrA cell cycle regulator n=1 Tax=Bosea eneae TaxID=151454 RepID=A0ABW0IXT1_9HYPH
MTIWRRNRQRRLATRRIAERVLDREERLAREICAAIHYGGCTCAQNAAADSCGKMKWAAKRAIRFLHGEGASS